jgi:AbrB family looped-hinge helix DNA binding protein
MTEKGQVTIPIEIRNQLGLRAGDEIEITVQDGVVCMTRAATAPSRGRRIVESLRGKGRSELSTDEIMALTRGE